MLSLGQTSQLVLDEKYCKSHNTTKQLAEIGVDENKVYENDHNKEYLKRLPASTQPLDPKGRYPGFPAKCRLNRDMSNPDQKAHHETQKTDLLQFSLFNHILSVNGGYYIKIKPAPFYFSPKFNTIVYVRTNFSRVK